MRAKLPIIRDRQSNVYIHEQEYFDNPDMRLSGQKILINYYNSDFPNNYWWKKYIWYYYNKTTWMTMTIFDQWILEFNKILADRNEHALLLIDNAGGNDLSFELLEKLTHVKVEYLLPNTTSVLQPLDADIIKGFKTYYIFLCVTFIYY